MNIQSYMHINKSLLPKNKINFTKILKNKSTFKNPTLMVNSLNKGTISTKNYDMKRLGRGINLKKIGNKSFEIKNEKKEIFDDLANIMEQSEKNFNKFGNIYQKLKKENDTFISYWHYTQKIKEKLEKLNNAENELENGVKNSEYKKISKMYDFSIRDKIEMDLQKNLSKNIFKSNPLMINDENEMFLHFLKETDKSPNRSVNFNEQNSSRYLIKIKDFLEYISILHDKSMDQVNKKIKLSNCNYVQNQRKKIENEKLQILKEQKRNEIKEISESRRMIEYSKILLNELDQNKDYLEDPNYFTFYRNSHIKSLTPHRKTKHQIFMNKSSRSEFFIDSKHHFLNKDKYDTMRILKLKKNNLSRQLSSLLNESNNIKRRSIKKLRINNISPLFHKSNNESFSKDNNNSSYNMNFCNSKISNNNNSTNTIFTRRYNNRKILPSIKSYLPYNVFTKSSISNSIHQPFLVDENKFESKNPDSINMDNTIKELNLNLNLNNETDGGVDNINNSNNSELSIKNSNFEKENNDYNKKNSEEEINNENKYNNKKESNNGNDRNKPSKESNKKIIVISDLYNGVKDMKNLNKENIKEIDSYIKQEDIEYKRSKNTIALLKYAQLVIDEFDINKIAKNFSDIKNEEYKKIKIFKNMNKKLKKLDRKYMQDIIRFKARNLKND